MANTKNAQKALRVAERRTVINTRRRRTMKAAVKEVREAGSKEEATKLMPAAYKALDKAVKGGVIKENTSSRIKSRLSKSVAKREK